MLSFLLSEKLSGSGSGSGIGISSLGRLAVLLVDGIQLVGIFGLPMGIWLGKIGVSNFWLVTVSLMSFSCDIVGVVYGFLMPVGLRIL